MGNVDMNHLNLILRITAMLYFCLFSNAAYAADKMGPNPPVNLKMSSTNVISKSNADIITNERYPIFMWSVPLDNGSCGTKNFYQYVITHLTNNPWDGPRIKEGFTRNTQIKIGPLAEGRYKFWIQAKDRCENWGQWSGIGFTIWDKLRNPDIINTKIKEIKKEERQFWNRVNTRLVSAKINRLAILIAQKGYVENEYMRAYLEEKILSLPGHFILVERSPAEFNEVLKNLKLEMSDLFDKKTASRLGKFLGAQAVIIAKDDRVKIIESETISILFSEILSWDIINLYTTLSPNESKPDYREKVYNGKLIDIIVNRKTFAIGDKADIYVKISNNSKIRQHYLIALEIRAPNDSIVYDSHRGSRQHTHTGDDCRDIWLNPKDHATVGPFSYRFTKKNMRGKYHIISGLRIYPWEPKIMFRGAKWCAPEETLYFKK